MPRRSCPLQEDRRAYWLLLLLHRVLAFLLLSVLQDEAYLPVTLFRPRMLALLLRRWSVPLHLPAA